MSAAMSGGRNMARLRFHEPMSLHTSWRIGGAADIFFRPAAAAELKAFLAGFKARDDILWVGLGSNLLVRDGGIRGVVICTLDLATRIRRLDARRIYVGAGTSCTMLARQCTRWKLGPAAFFAGIPGTLGGALAMNAGAFGGETWDLVESVDTVDVSGRSRTRSRADFQVGYRSVESAAGEWFLGATLALADDPAGQYEPACRDADPAGQYAAAGRTQLRLGVPQPAGRFCGPAYRSFGTQGPERR